LGDNKGPEGNLRGDRGIMVVATRQFKGVKILISGVCGFVTATWSLSYL